MTNNPTDSRRGGQSRSGGAANSDAAGTRAGNGGASNGSASDARAGDGQAGGGRARPERSGVGHAVTGSTQVRIVIPEEQPMISLLGSGDELLRVIENAVKADFHVRGNEITITGPAAETAVAARLIEELMELVAGGAELTVGLDRAQRVHAAQEDRDQACRSSQPGHFV